MTSLIIEASGPSCLLQFQKEQSLHFYQSEADGRHDQRLLPAIQTLLAQHHTQLSELDWLGVGVGPGSFTGIRVGIALAQGISIAGNCQLRALDSMALMALQAGDGRWQVALDARLGEVYTAVYQVLEGQITTLQAPCLATYPIKALQTGCLPLGDGWELETGVAPQAPAACLAWQDYAQAQIPVAAADLLPVYLRDTVNWKKVSEQPSPLAKG